MIKVLVDIRDFNLKGLKRKINKLPNKLEEVGNVYGRSLVRRIKLNITAKKLLATGELHDSVRWVQAGLTGVLFMKGYAYDLQQERPKQTIVKPYTSLWRWAFLKSPFRMHHGTSASFPALKAKISAKKPITLHKYDVYATPMANTNRDLRGLVERRVGNFLKVGY